MRISLRINMIILPQNNTCVKQTAGFQRPFDVQAQHAIILLTYLPRGLNIYFVLYSLTVSSYPKAIILQKIIIKKQPITELLYIS